MNQSTSKLKGSGSAELGNSRELVDHFFRKEYAKLVATLTSKLGVSNWELAEDVVQSALQRALSSWSLKGIPKNPSAWLFRVAFNLAIDHLRRDAKSTELDSMSCFTQKASTLNKSAHDEEVDDNLLRMVFVCCHPSVPAESQIALSLKTLCGFGNREIARALLTTEGNVAKRITRAKFCLRELKVEPAELTKADFERRLSDVQKVVYLLFNEGYSSSVAEKLIREELCEEAVRMALILAEHSLTAGPSSSAFLALLLFHAARLDARIDVDGAMLLLKEQDRSRWDQRLIQEGFKWFRRSHEGEVMTRYHAEAFIASEHCRANSMAETDWSRIAHGYEILCKLSPSPVHEINYAIAIGRRDGPADGLKYFEQIDSADFGSVYYLWHATRAELAKQTGDLEVAKLHLQKAWKLAPTNAEKEMILRKLDSLF